MGTGPFNFTCRGIWRIWSFQCWEAYLSIKKSRFSPVDALILALVATRKLQFMVFANQGRIARGQPMIGSVLHGATPASLRVWFLKARDHNHKQVDLSDIETEAKQIDCQGQSPL